MVMTFHDICTVVNNQKSDCSGLNGMIISEASRIKDLNTPRCYVICTFPVLVNAYTELFPADVKLVT
jgi:hypothetical protein